MRANVGLSQPNSLVEYGLRFVKANERTVLVSTTLLFPVSLSVPDRPSISRFKVRVLEGALTALLNETRCGSGNDLLEDLRKDPLVLGRISASAGTQTVVAVGAAESCGPIHERVIGA